MEIHFETKHGLSQLHAVSVSNQPYDHADALTYAIYQTKTPDTFVCSGCYLGEVISNRRLAGSVFSSSSRIGLVRTSAVA